MWPMALLWWAAVSGLLLLPLIALSVRLRRRRVLLPGLVLSLVAGLLWLPSVADTVALQRLDAQFQLLRQNRLNPQQTGLLLQQTQAHLSDCADCPRLQQLLRQLQLRYADQLWQQAQAERQSGSPERQLALLNRALQALSGAGAEPELHFHLLARIGQLQRQLHPAAERQLQVEIAGQGWLGDRLLLTVRLQQGPDMPLARKEIEVDRWPMQLQLGSDDALLPGFDLSAAYGKGDRMLVEAAVLSADEQVLARGQRQITAEQQVSLHLEAVGAAAP